MMNGNRTMFGRLKGRILSAPLLAAILVAGISGDVLGQAWELERESGVGGGGSGNSAKVAAQPVNPNNPNKKVGVWIEIIPDDAPVIREAEGVPVSPFGDEPQIVQDADADAKAAVAAAQAETEALERASRAGAEVPAQPKVGDETKANVALFGAQAETEALERASRAGAEVPAQPKVVAETRANPPTAAELLKGIVSKPIEATAVAALPNAEHAPRPAARPKALTDVVSPAPSPIEQAQFSPNTAAAPKAIVPPRAGEGASNGATAAPVILPSPRKPVQPEASVQQAVLAPNVAASPKESVLRTAPTPDNSLVELVETPSDYSLAVSAGTAQVLNLGKAVTNVFVADPNVADVDVLSPKQIVVHGNELGRTNIFGLGNRGDVIFAIDVDTVPNAGAANAKLNAAAPATKTEVALQAGTLVAAGEVSDVGEAIDIKAVTEGLQNTQGPTVNNTTIAGSQQVNIRVRFAEVSRSDVFNLGINWDALVDTGDFLFGLSTGNFLSNVGDLSAREIANLNGEQFGRVDFTGEFGDVSIDAFIDALQREGIVNVLAEPNLTSVNGEPANFLAGGEIPILVPGGGGGDTVTIDYKPFGVSLDFIPTLLQGERINLRVRPEVSSISQAGAVVLDGFSVPAFTVRRAETTIELASGQTFAIAGLFQRDLATDTDKFPVLGDVPVLGQLFKSQRFRRSETELVILITPYLVKPTSNRNIALPNDRLDTPTSPLIRKDRKGAGFIVN